MLTRRAQLAVSAALIWVSACAGRQGPVTPATAANSADALQFDNQATVYVDVYLVGDPIQWRLGRVPPGMRTNLRVPESALGWTTGFVQLVVIPNSQISGQASRDPRAILAILQPVSEVLSQRWTFHQPAGAPLQLQATRLP